MLIVVLVFVLSVGPKFSLSIESRLFSGALIEYHPHIIGYQSVIPLVFNVHFGNIHPVIPFDDLGDFLSCNPTQSPKPPTTPATPLSVIFNHSIQEATFIGKTIHQTLCNLSEVTNQLFQTTREILLRDYDDENPEKQRRGAQFIGDIMKYCCELATQEDLQLIHYNAKYLTQHINQLQEIVHSDHRDFVKITKQIDSTVEAAKEALEHNYRQIQAMADALADAEEDSSKLWHYYLIHSHHQIFLSYIMAYQTHITSAKLDCELKRLPKSVLKSKTVKKDLEDLKTKLGSTDYELAVPINEIKKYFQLPITTCKFFEDDLVVTVRIPLKRKLSNFEFIRVKPIPLLWDQDICQLGTSPQILVNSSGTMIPIRDSESCQITKEPLCLIPRYIEVTEISQLCVKNLIQGTSLEQLKSICEFHCHPRLNNTYVTKLTPSTFFLTNVQNTTYLSCEDKKTQLPTGHYGILKVQIPCKCEVHQNDEVLIQPQFPCDVRHPENFEITHEIPYLWLNLSHFKLSPAEMTNLPAFHKVNPILNEHWNLSFAKIKISNENYEDVFQPLTIPPSFNRQDYHEIFTCVLFGWSTLVTFILVYLCCQFKLLKTEIAAKTEIMILKRPE